jgi:hypothetical protein
MSEKWVELTDWQQWAIDHVMAQYDGPVSEADINFLKEFLRKAKRIKALVETP